MTFPTPRDRNELIAIRCSGFNAREGLVTFPTKVTWFLVTMYPGSNVSMPARAW